MAKVNDNIVTDGLIGKLGKRLVFRRGRGGRTIVGTGAAYDDVRKFNDAQLAHHEAFKMAIVYAKVAKKNPVYVQLAKGAEATAYNLAVADWFGKPQVLNIDSNGWSGQSGHTISIKAVDDTKVTNVRVVIHNNGTILEEGEAVPSDHDGLLWTYVTRTNVTAAPGILLDANAYDLAGNFGASSISMN